MADSKLADLTEDTAPGGDSLVYTVDDPGGAPADRKVAVKNLVVPRVEQTVLSGDITRSSTSFGSFSTPWTLSFTTDSASESVRLRAMFRWSDSGAAGSNLFFRFKRDSTALRSWTVRNLASGAPILASLEWVDVTPGAGTFTYELEAAAVSTLTVDGDDAATISAEKIIVS